MSPSEKEEETLVKRFIRELLAQLITLLVLGAVLVWIWTKQAEAIGLNAHIIYRAMLWFATFVYVLLCISSFRLLSSKYGMKRFNPANLESLKELSGQKNFKLPKDIAALLARSGSPGDYLLSMLGQIGYRRVDLQNFGLVFERQTWAPLGWIWPRYQRVVVFHRQVMNVIVLDQMLSELAEYIMNSPRLIKHNVFFVIADMQNEVEVLSTAAGAANFLGRIDEGVTLIPALLDYRFGRLFYPVDHSLLSFKDAAVYLRLRQRLYAALRKMPVAGRPMPADEQGGRQHLPAQPAQYAAAQQQPSAATAPPKRMAAPRPTAAPQHVQQSSAAPTGSRSLPPQARPQSGPTRHD